MSNRLCDSESSGSNNTEQYHNRFRSTDNKQCSCSRKLLSTEERHVEIVLNKGWMRVVNGARRMRAYAVVQVSRYILLVCPEKQWSVCGKENSDHSCKAGVLQAIPHANAFRSIYSTHKQRERCAWSPSSGGGINQTMLF